MALITETITGDGSDTYTLANSFKDGTTKITKDGVLIYEYREKTTDQIVFDFVLETGETAIISYYKSSVQNVLNAVRYATPKQVKTLSRMSSLVAENDEDIEKIIREAEQYLDAYCSYLQPIFRESGQRLKFPREKDDKDYVYARTNYLLDYDGIPEKVTLACVRAIEAIYLAGEQTKEDIDRENLESERMGDYNYKTKGGSPSEIAGRIIGSRSRALLSGYRRKSGSVRVFDQADQNSEVLNSRQRFLQKY